MSDDELRKYVGKNIKTIRTKMHMTQKAFAERICVSESTVAKWEQGKILIPTDMLIQLIATFNVKYEELLPDSTHMYFCEWFMNRYHIGDVVVIMTIKPDCFYKKGDKRIYITSEEHLDAFNRPIKYRIKSIDFNDKSRTKTVIKLESDKNEKNFSYKRSIDLMRVYVGFYRLVAA